MDEVILSRIRQEAYEQGYQDGKVDGYNLAGTRMSSAKQERKKGKWLWLDGVRCSNCNYKLQTTGLPTSCPNCGVKMD